MKCFPALPCLFLLAGFAFGAPKITCDQPVFDFGNKNNAETVRHTFIVKNQGTGTLNIARVKPACGCTVANISSKVLAPGQSTQITATLALKGRIGPQNKPMTVYSNDPKKPSFQLTLKGNAVTEVTVSPTALSFGRVEEGQSITKEVKISSQKPIRIKSITSAKKQITHNLITLKPGREFLLKITNVKDIPPGRISDTITITTDSPKSPTQRITVYGTVLDKLTVSPNPLVIPETAGVKIDRSIYVRAGSVKTFHVLSAEWPGSNTKAHINNLGIRGFTVTFKGIEATKALNGSEILLRTDVEGRALIRIPVTIRPTSPLKRR